MKKTRFMLGISATICIGIASFESHAVNSTYTLGVDISGASTPWSHFYEYSVGTCHPLTVLSDAYDNRSIRERSGGDIRNAVLRTCAGTMY